ncbi:MAG: hypothetical protein AAGF01_26385 [Cyanobacteria bacterium P01_G01_bin.38]
MQVQWPKLFSRTLIWLCAEIALTCLGLDDLADYGEFVFQDRSRGPASAVSIALVIAV